MAHPNGKSVAGLDRDSKSIDLAEQNQPPARRSAGAQPGGSISGSGTRPNDPKS